MFHNIAALRDFYSHKNGGILECYFGHHFTCVHNSYDAPDREGTVNN